MTATALALLVPGCLHHSRKVKPTVPTKTARGEKVETGSPIYDEYFDTVHELHVLVTTARLEERDARSTLASMLDLLPTASPDQLLGKLREQAKTLPAMSLTVDDKVSPPKAKVSLARGASADEPVKGFATVLEATANAELSISRRAGEVPERAHRMHNVGTTLVDGAAKDFASRPPDERDQIDAELDAAQDLLVVLARDAEEIAKAALAFVVHMQEALEASGTEAPQRDPPKPAPKPAPTQRRNQPTDFNP